MDEARLRLAANKLEQWSGFDISNLEAYDFLRALLRETVRDCAEVAEADHRAAWMPAAVARAIRERFAWLEEGR